MDKKVENPCHQCGKREIEFAHPGKWCVVCWADWWFQPSEDETPESLLELQKERLQFLKEEGYFDEVHSQK